MMFRGDNAYRFYDGVVFIKIGILRKRVQYNTLSKQGMYRDVVFLSFDTIGIYGE
jgi:hypothetical protein